MNKTEPVYVTIPSARLSFPQLAEAKGFAGDPNSKAAFSATFLLNKKDHAKTIAAIQAGIAKLVKEELKGKHPGASKVCLRDGTEKPDTDGYGPDMMFIGARNEKRPLIVDRDLSALTATDAHFPYAGCYVQGVLRLWVQDNKFGKRINASLVKIGFVKDGEPFGQGSVPEEHDLKPVEDDEGSVV